MVMEVVEEETGEEGDSIQCADHHFKNGSSPGGICALCLQEKLGKLATSSFPEPISISSSSSSMSPLIRSEFGSIETDASSSSTSSRLRLGCGSSSNGCECHQNHRRRSKFPFLLNHGKKKKKKDCVAAPAATCGDTNNIVFRRSKSTANNNTRNFNLKEANEYHNQEKKGFWSFLYLPSTKHSTTEKSIQSSNPNVNPTNSLEPKNKDPIFIEKNESPDELETETAFENKVSRSRSIACGGSRSFSGDLFERISTGFGDCTLRRVESHREGKNKLNSIMHRNSVTGSESDCIKRRVKCGGFFSGFMIGASSSSSSYCISSADEENGAGKRTETPGRHRIGNLSHAR